MDRDLLPLTDAAAQLGVSVERVRQLVVAGDLPGIRFGNAWVVPSGAVAARRHQANKRGRPLGQRRAWEEILSGSISLDDAGRYRHRARAHRGQLARGDLAFISDHEEVLVSGVAAAMGYGEPLVDDPSSAVLYLAASLFEPLSRSIAFVDDGLGSVVIQVVEDPRWDLVLDRLGGGGGSRLAPRAAVAIDLMASDDPRHWLAAEHLVGARG